MKQFFATFAAILAATAVIWPLYAHHQKERERAERQQAIDARRSEIAHELATEARMRGLAWEQKAEELATELESASRDYAQSQNKSARSLVVMRVERAQIHMKEIPPGSRIALLQEAIARAQVALASE